MTIGTYDGVHVGHRKILERIVHEAAESGYESLVLSFFPHPRMVLGQGDAIKLLNTIDEKIELLNLLGLDHLIIHPFSESFSALTPEEFVRKILVGRFNIAKIVIGHDHRFGNGRSAGFDDLVAFSKQYGFEVEQIPASEIDAVAVSSTKIRKALSSGNISMANEYLGYRYFLSGKVVEGKKLGRTIGFATANLEVPESYKQIPKNGVYAVAALFGQTMAYGMVNIGNRPTVKGDKKTIEVHVIDFESDLYGQTVRLAFLAWLRDEKQFESLVHLQEQLKKDLVQTRNIVKP